MLWPIITLFIDSIPIRTKKALIKNMNWVNFVPRNISSCEGITISVLSSSFLAIIFLISCPPMKNEAIRAVIVTLLVKSTIGNSFNPGVAIPVFVRIKPIRRPKTTIIKIGEYLVPATNVLATRTIDITIKKVSQN